jgi:hypothetical protein
LPSGDHRAWRVGRGSPPAVVARGDRMTALADRVAKAASLQSAQIRSFDRGQGNGRK